MGHHVAREGKALTSQTYSLAMTTYDGLSFRHSLQKPDGISLPKVVLPKAN